MANLIGLGTPSLSSPITGPVRTPSASRLIGPTLMKQEKQVFYCGERNPLRQRKERRGEAETVCGGETIRGQNGVCVCVCSGGAGGGFFMQVSRLQWADSPPKSLIKAHHLSSFSLLSLSPCSVLQSIHHHPLCATEQLTTL